MDNQNEKIAKDLITMVKSDFELQEELAKTEDLQAGYHPKLEEMHYKNSEKLKVIIYEIGWPTVSKVGEEAAYAAWMVLQHAISNPELQKEALPLLMELANNNEIYPSEVAVLYDRICYFELRPQRYGTQFDFDENGNLNPWKLEDPNKVEMYRKQVGLPPLDETVIRMREIAKQAGEKPNKPYEDRLKEREMWAKQVGWIK